MWHQSRAALLAAVFVLASGGSAFASFAPSLSVSSTPAVVTVAYTQGAADDAFGAITLAAPLDYFANLQGLPGSSVGTFAAKGVLADQGNAATTLTGKVAVALPTDTIAYAGATPTAAQVAAACTGTATHTAYWMVNTTAGGQVVQMPVLVDQIVNGHNPYRDQVSVTLTFCQPPSAVPAGTAGRAPLGLDLTDVTFDFKNVFSVAPGWYAWNAAAYPYAAGAVKKSAAGVSMQSIDRTLQVLTLTAKAGKQGKASIVAISGRLRAGGALIAGASVAIMNGTKTITRLKTNSKGSYSGKIRLASTATLKAVAAVSPTAGAACQDPIFSGIACTGSTFGGYTAASTPVKVKV